MMVERGMSHISHPHLGGLVAAASASPKVGNQDACATFRTQGGSVGVLIADGLGSHYRAEVGSRLAVRAAARALERGSDLDLDLAFAAAGAAIDAEAQRSRDAWPRSIDDTCALGTTLISAVDTGDHLVVGYLGNGAVHHVRGNFDAFPAAQLLPWTSLNILNPHSCPEQGQPALYRYLGPANPGGTRQPSVVRLSQDAHFFGDIVIVCTDGICSYDQTPIGRDAGGRIWVAGDESMVRLYAALARFLDEGPHTSAALRAVLLQYVNRLVESGLAEDDCTVGVIVTAAAVERRKQTRSGAAAGGVR
jgi:hypothetical protein